MYNICLMNFFTSDFYKYSHSKSKSRYWSPSYNSWKLFALLHTLTIRVSVQGARNTWWVHQKCYGKWYPMQHMESWSMLCFTRSYQEGGKRSVAQIELCTGGVLFLLPLLMCLYVWINRVSCEYSHHPLSCSEASQLQVEKPFQHINKLLLERNCANLS